MTNAILDVEQVERIIYDSGCLSIRIDQGSAEAVIYRGMPVDSAISALRRLASQLELGAQERSRVSVPSSKRSTEQ
jgi:hypothetical protein